MRIRASACLQCLASKTYQLIQFLRKRMPAKRMSQDMSGLCGIRIGILQYVIAEMCFCKYLLNSVFTLFRRPRSMAQNVKRIDTL